MMRLIKLELLQCRYQYMTLMIIVLCGFFLLGFGGYFLEYLGPMEIGYMSDVVNTIYGIVAGVFTVGVMILCFAVIVQIFSTFSSSMFKLNGYLYNTLPVTSYELVGSKLIAAIIWLVVFSILMIVASFMMIAGILLAVAIDNISLLFSLIGQIDFKYVLDLCIRMFRSLFDGNGKYLVQSFLSVVGLISSGYTIITLVHLPFIQRLSRAYRYAVYMIVIIIILLMMTYIDLPWLEPWLVLTIIGVLGYLLTCYLVANKIDVAG